MRSAGDIFNTLRVFTKEPIREQEIDLECMNNYYPSLITYMNFCLYQQNVTHKSRQVKCEDLHLTTKWTGLTIMV